MPNKTRSSEKTKATFVKERINHNRTIIFTIYYLGQCGGGFGRKVERKIELRETQTLDDLHEAIIYQSLGWDDPHLYAFHLDNIPYSKNRKMEYTNDSNGDMFSGGKANSSKIKLRALNLKKKQKFLFVFDFGDDHRFGIVIEDFGKAEKGKDYPNILEKKGKAPKQYPLYR